MLRDLIRTYGSERTFVHPFVVEVPGTGDGARYELVLQYWLF